MQNLSSQKGFTLIELLIVITIISTLAIMSVGSYIGSKQSSLLKLGTEKMFSDLSSSRDSMGHGNFDNSSRASEIKSVLDGDVENTLADDFVAKCFGYEFSDDGVKRFSLSYSGKKKFNPIFERFEFVGCADLDTREYDDYQLEKDIKIASLKRNDMELESFLIWFSPPFGDVFYDFSVSIPKLEIVDALSNEVIRDAEVFEKKTSEYEELKKISDDSAVSVLADKDEVVLGLTYGNINDENRYKYIKFDVLNDEISME